MSAGVFTIRNMRSQSKAVTTVMTTAITATMRKALAT